jgi:transcriptional regulator with XRE-family HTH domain
LEGFHSDIKGIPNHELEWQEWITENIGNLITLAPSLRSKPPKTNIATSISTLIYTSVNKRLSEFAKLAQTDAYTIRAWLKGTQLPTIGKLLSVCRLMQLEVKSLLCLDVRISPNYSQFIIEEEIKPVSKRLINWDSVEKQLNIAIGDTPPPSLTKVAKQIGAGVNTLQTKYPELCATIISRFLSYWIKPFDPVKAKVFIRAALKENPPPSITQIVKRLGGEASGAILQKHFPKEYRKIVDRYLDQRKKPFDLEGVSAKLQAELEAIPPRSLRQVSQSLGIIRSWLYKKLPNLCKAISTRYEAFRKDLRKKDKEQLKGEVYRIVVELHSKGVYPSVTYVHSLLSMPNCSNLLVEVIRELKHEANLPYWSRKYVN